MFERSKEWRKCLAELHEEQRKEFGEKLNKILEENRAHQIEYAKKYWEQQRDKELKEYMKKYTNETIHIKSLFRKKVILYTTYPRRNRSFISLFNPDEPTMVELTDKLRAYLLMSGSSIRLGFYNDDEYRCKKHERMLRYMRSKYPIEF